MGTETVAVLDVGKTNKKISLYDREWRVVGEERTSFAQKDFQGVEVEDTEGLLAWFRVALKKLAKDHTVRAIAITAHGATLTLLDAEGKLAFPVVSYTWPGGAVIQDEFYETFGDPVSLHRQTGTPDIGFVNMAKVLYYTKTRMPEVWARCARGLFYGPYLAYELSGGMGLEPTFPGNHTYLWDFHRGDWSDVAIKLGADKLFGLPMAPPWDVIGNVKPDVAEECGVPADCKMTLGIHDSNANFLPYLAKGYSEFLLISSGTWGVLMRPADSANLSDEEIAAKVFFNQDVLARPVRTSLLTLGMDYDAFRAGTELKDQSTPDDVRKVVNERKLFVVPGAIPEATAFPGSPARVVNGDSEVTLEALRRDGGTPFTGLGQDYYAALALGLAIATKKMLGYCRVTPGTVVFIEGGFAKNSAYCSALAALCPEQRFCLTAMKEGTAFGAAITGWMAADNLTLEQVGERFEIETTDVPRADLGDIAAYEAEMFRMTS
ncbi:MAG: FGGY family carbohydrate kinase [Rhodospirillales bacterium]|nr:FGGY family carbohydrate kinase [Rhodospirillales bacterium]